MPRFDRTTSHRKQTGSRIKVGRAKLEDLREGVPEYRLIDSGMVMYMKHSGILYKTRMDKARDDDPTEGQISSKQGENGYIEFAGGVIFQWGRAGDIDTTDALGTTTTVTFPKKFPKNCWTVVGTYWLEGTDVGGVGETSVQGHIGVNETSFGRDKCVFTTDTDIEALFFIAIGN